MEVWDWDRLTSNDYIGGFSLPVSEIILATQEEPLQAWYKLLDEKQTYLRYERILEDDEAQKVREGGRKT